MAGSPGGGGGGGSARNGGGGRATTTSAPIGSRTLTCAVQATICEAAAPRAKARAITFVACIFATKALRLLGRKRRFRIGLCQIVFGICLIFAGLLGVTVECAALFEGYIMIAIRLCGRHVISTFGFRAV
jgi:hypothetical protein